MRMGQAAKAPQVRVNVYVRRMRFAQSVALVPPAAQTEVARAYGPPSACLFDLAICPTVQ
jgi:hypothetical protein